MFDQLPFGGGVSVGLVPTILTTARNSKWARIVDVNKFLCILICTNKGTAGDDIVVTLEQATSNAGAGAKPLLAKRVAYKVGDPIDPDLFTVIESITNEAPAASIPTAAYDSAENEFLLLIRVRPQDLDIDGGFTHVRANIAAVTNAQYGSVLFMPEGYAYNGKDVEGVVQ